MNYGAGRDSVQSMTECGHTHLFTPSLATWNSDSRTEDCDREEEQCALAVLHTGTADPGKAGPSCVEHVATPSLWLSAGRPPEAESNARGDLHFASQSPLVSSPQSCPRFPSAQPEITKPKPQSHDEDMPRAARNRTACQMTAPEPLGRTCGLLHCVY